MRKWILILSPFVFLTLLIAGLRIFVQPKVEAWALAYFEEFAKHNLPVEIDAEKFELEWISPKVRLSKAQIKPHGNQKLGFDKIEVENAEAHLDLISLLAGRIYLSIFILDGVKTNVDLDPLMDDPSPAKEIPLDKVFSVLDQVPIYNFAIVNGEVIVKSKKENIDATVRKLAIKVANQTKRLSFDIQIPEASVELEKLRLPMSLRGSGKITPKSLEFANLDLRTSGQSVQLSGYFNDPHRLTIHPTGSIKISAHADGPALTKALAERFKFPKLTGSLGLEAQVQVNGKNIPDATFTLNTQDVFIAGSQLGTLNMTGQFKDSTLRAETATLKHAAGVANLSDISLKIGLETDPILLDLKGKIQTDELNLFELLKNVGVGEIPVQLKTSGQFDCAGPLMPKFSLVCVGEAKVKHLEVRPDVNEDPIIVELAGAFAKGGVQITGEAVSYNANVTLGEDHGKSTGLISYAKGFQIQYDTPGVDLGHLKHIAGLKVEGRTQISGSTSGNSDYGVFEMNVKGEKVFFEDYQLGNVDTKVKYAKGVLTFDHIEGHQGESVYRGKVEAFLNQQRLKIKGSSAQINWGELAQVFQRHLTIPVEVGGNGTFEIDLEGPYKLNALTYKFQARLPKLTVAGESFSNGELVVTSNKGQAVIDSAKINKGSRSIAATGRLDSTGELDIQLRSDQLLLEESEYLSRITSNMSGSVDGRLTMKGYISDPSFFLEANLSNLVIEDQEFPPSVTAVNLSSKELKGSVSLFAGHLISDFQFPLTETGPFKLKLKAFDWNYATLATMIGGASLLSEYETAITGTLELSSNRGGLWNASGEGTIQKFVLKRGQQELRNPRPMKLVMKDGVADFQQFRVEGGKDFFQLTGGRVSQDNLRLKFEGQSNLRIFQIFVPPLEELGGVSRFDVSVSGSLSKPEVLGSAHLSEGFAKLRGFPHPFERLSAQVQFSHTKVLISEIHGSFAGGTLNGDGSVLLQGLKQFPTNIRARAEGVTLNVPDKVRTTGSLDLNFTGQWFPFLLSGRYRVNGGLIEKEVDDDTGIAHVQQSSYLPKVILQSAFEPITLDLQVDLDRPLAIKNSQVEGSITGSLNIKGTPNNPILFGTITIPPGTKLTFRDKVFEVANGTIKFNDPKELNPEIYVSARSRINEYDVNILVQGNKKNPVVRMSSTPPLGEQDIATLLALGVTSEKLDRRVTTNRDQETNSGYEAGSAIFQQTLAKPIEKTTGFNVQLSSGYDDTKNVATQKVTVSRKLSDKVEVQASRARGEQTTDEAKIKYFFTPNFSAVGSFEKVQEQTIDAGQTPAESVLGIDLEFKKEFK